MGDGVGLEWRWSWELSWSLTITIVQKGNMWHSSLTEENRQDLERVQKAALKVILRKDYLNYEDALKLTNLPSLDERRQAISSERAELKDLWCLRLMGRPGIRPSQV